MRSAAGVRRLVFQGRTTTTRLQCRPLLLPPSSPPLLVQQQRQRGRRRHVVLSVMPPRPLRLLGQSATAPDQHGGRRRRGRLQRPCGYCCYCCASVVLPKGRRYNNNNRNTTMMTSRSFANDGAREQQHCRPFSSSTSTSTSISTTAESSSSRDSRPKGNYTDPSPKKDDEAHPERSDTNNIELNKPHGGGSGGSRTTTTTMVANNSNYNSKLPLAVRLQMQQQQRHELVQRMMKLQQNRQRRKRWRPFLPPEVVAVEREAAAAAATTSALSDQHEAFETTTSELVSSSLSSSSSSLPRRRVVIANMSLDELKDRTRKIKQWCVFANDKGRDRAQRAATRGELQPILEEIVVLLEEWRDRARVVVVNNNNGNNGNNGMTAAQQAHDLYSVVQTTQPARDYLDPLALMDVVLAACANCCGDGSTAGSGHPEAARLAEQTFVRSFHPARIQSYNLLLQCWARSASSSAASSSSSSLGSGTNSGQPKEMEAIERSERLWHDILEEVEQHQRCYPTNETIVHYMSVWTNSRAADAPEKVTDLLRQILHERQPAILSLPPPQQLSPPPPPIKTNANHGTKQQQRRQQQPPPPAQQPPPPPKVVLRSKVLQRILHPPQSPPPPPPRPLLLLSPTADLSPLSWQQQRHRQRLDYSFLRHNSIRAREILQRHVRHEPSSMQQRQLGRAIEETRQPAAARRPVQIRQPSPQQQQQQQQQQAPPPPRQNVFRNVQLDDPAVFHGALQAWGTCGRGRAAALEAERIVRHVMPQYGCRPNGTTYALLAAAWAEVERLEKGADDAAARAEDVLQQDYLLMVQEQQQEQQKEIRFNSIADAFTTCITAWSLAATHQQDAPARAEALWRQLLLLLQQLQHQQKQTGLLDHRDNALSSALSSPDNNAMDDTAVVAAENAVLLTWARCCSDQRPDAVSHLQQFFASMKHPNLASYNTLLDGYARRGMRREARELFDAMKKHDRRELHPDLVSYNTLLKAMAQADDTPIEVVETLLHEMENVMSPVDPDKFTYTRVLEAWAKASHPERIQNCKRLVDIMIYRSKRGKRESRPDAFAHVILIDACLNTDDRPRSINVATETIERLQSTPYLTPTASEHVHYEAAYVLYLRALVKYKGRSEKLSRTIIKCAQGGWVSANVIRELQRADQIKSDPLTLLKDYDRSWSRNVKERDRPCPMLKFTKDCQGELQRAVRLPPQPIYSYGRS